MWLPSLAMLLRSARYRVCWPADAVRAVTLRDRVSTFLAHSSLDWEEHRGERVRRIDLRAMVRGLEVEEPAAEEGGVAVDGTTCLRLHVVLTHDRTMRPASLLAALDIEALPVSVVRTAIEVDHPRVALRAWRERGRFA